MNQIPKGISKNVFIEKPVAFLSQLFTITSYFLPNFKFRIAGKCLIAA
jgi:hypothetical protein